MAARVALVPHSPWLGGAERCVLELASGLAGAGCDVHALVPGAPRGELAAALAADGARVHDVPARWWVREPGARWRGLDLRGVARTVAALRRVRPDVVVSGSLVHPAGAVAARVLGLPHVWWVQEFATADHAYRLPLGERGTLRLVGALSDRIVVLSEALRHFVVTAGVPEERVVVIPPAPAVAASRSIACTPDVHAMDHRLVLAGRVRRSKGHWEAVEAVRLLQDRGVPVTLDVLGDGELDALRAHAAAQGVADRVAVRGGGHDVAAVLDGADVALTPSRCEAFGRVTVEAQLRGVPVVGAAGGGTTELLAGGRGLTHAPGDAGGLADAVERLLADDDLRAATATAGWEHARATFTPARQTAAWLALLGQVAR